MNTTPNRDEAIQFALLLQAGLPAMDAIRYFIAPTETLSEAQVREACNWWIQSRAVRGATNEVIGKEWKDMTIQDRMNLAINKHYSELSYYLFTHNYSDLKGADKTKADTARSAIEAKLAGMAGKGDALTQFLDDLRSGRLEGRLNPRPTPLQLVPN